MPPPKTHDAASTADRPARRPTSSSSSSGSTACSARSTRCRDRLAFFWHRHWAISRDDGSVSDQWVFAYRNRLLEYADFGALPGRDVPRSSPTR